MKSSRPVLKNRARYIKRGPCRKGRNAWCPSFCVSPVVGSRTKADIRQMDASNPSAITTFANSTPLHIGTVALTVRDLDRMVGYYRDLLGLSEMTHEPGVVQLGAGGVVLLELVHRPDAKPNDAHEAGL